jgi:hypothetical protein
MDGPLFPIKPKYENLIAQIKPQIIKTQYQRDFQYD